MRRLIPYGLTLAAFVVSALFVAGISANVYIGAFDEPAVSGKYAIQFALCFALIIG